jgi:hypothetical protein
MATKAGWHDNAYQLATIGQQQAKYGNRDSPSRQEDVRVIINIC